MTILFYRLKRLCPAVMEEINTLFNKILLQMAEIFVPKNGKTLVK